MKFINSNQVLKMIDKNRLALIIDIRDVNEYNLGHIPNSINIPIRNIEYNLEYLYQYIDEPILIYCSKGQASAIVCKCLEKKGFSNLYNLLNGIDNYKNI